MSGAFMNRGIVNSHIEKLVITDVGRHLPQFSRPYVTTIDNGRNLMDMANRIQQNNSTTTHASLFGGIAGQLVSPSAAPQGSIGIANGWDTRRLRFILEYHVQMNTGAYCIYYIQGYTDHPGIIMHGPNSKFDDNMLFFINSITAIQRSTVNTGLGTEIVDRVLGFDQLLSRNVFSMPNMYEPTNYYSLRPTDIFNGISNNYISQAMPGDMVIDTRNGMLNGVQSSKRDNNISSVYLSKIANAAIVGEQMAEYGGNNMHSQIEQSKQFVMENFVNENPFITALFSTNSGPMSNKSAFTIRDLENIDPGLSNRANYLAIGEQQKFTIDVRGDSQYWSNTDRETQVAAIISNALPALLTECMMYAIKLRATNRTFDSDNVIQIANAKSIVGTNGIKLFELFKGRLASEVIADFTYNGMETYDLDIDADIMNNIRIGISLNGGPMCYYDTPAYCDSLLTPLITTSSHQLQSMSHDFELITNYAKEAIVDMNSNNAMFHLHQ